MEPVDALALGAAEAVSLGAADALPVALGVGFCGEVEAPPHAAKNPNDTTTKRGTSFRMRCS